MFAYPLLSPLCFNNGSRSLERSLDVPFPVPRNVLRRRRRQTADLYEEYSRAAEATEDAAKISPGFL